LLLDDIQVRPEATEFRSKQFNIITHRKMEGIIAVMEMQHDVIFIDMDIALIRDPLPYLLWRNVDYVHSHNRICPQFEQWDFFKSDEEGNTGFYYARSNPRTLKLWKDALALSPSHPDLDDQSVFWIHIRQVQTTLETPLGTFSHASPLTRSLALCRPLVLTGQGPATVALAALRALRQHHPDGQGARHLRLGRLHLQRRGAPRRGVRLAARQPEAEERDGRGDPRELPQGQRQET